MTVRDALNAAAERNLDLVEVAPQVNPPVCRLIDYGKFRYEQTKRDRESRKSQKTVSLKEVRLRPKIDDHDLMVKGKAAERFLEEGDKVKMSVVFRGRELLIRTSAEDSWTRCRPSLAAWHSLTSRRRWKAAAW